MEAALDEISRAWNTLYDPEVVNACISLFRKRSFQFEPLQTAANSYARRTMEEAKPLK